MATHTLRPTGPGTYAEFTPNTAANWQNVDESVADGDSTYNSMASGTKTDAFATAGNLPGGTGYSVKLKVNGKTLSANGGVLSAFIIVGGTEYNVSLGFLTTNYAEYEIDWGTTNPVTTVAWTQAEINAMEIGYQVTFILAGSRITQVFLEITYTSNDVSVTPAQGALVTSLKTPTISLGTPVTPASKSVITARYAPSVNITDNKSVSPSTLALLLTQQGPGVLTAGRVIPATLPVVTTPQAPSAVLSENQRILPAPGSLNLTGLVPTVTTTFIAILTYVGNMVAKTVLQPQPGRAKRERL